MSRGRGEAEAEKCDPTLRHMWGGASEWDVIVTARWSVLYRRSNSPAWLGSAPPCDFDGAVCLDWLGPLDVRILSSDFLASHFANRRQKSNM